MSKLSTKLKERFGGHRFNSPCDDGCLCGIVFCTKHEPFTSCLVVDPELYLDLTRDILSGSPTTKKEDYK